MNEPEILSTLQLPESLTPSLAASATGNVRQVAARLLVFDACHVGVVLRAVLFVEAVVGVGLMFVRPMGWPWLLDLAAITAVAQPAVHVQQAEAACRRSSQQGGGAAKAAVLPAGRAPGV
jgi:two-component system sensor histidine kinase AlgZ